MSQDRFHDRFHGRVRGSGRACDWPGCAGDGEFRAPADRHLGARAPGFDGPGDYRWFCLDHVRAFNAGYDYFAGLGPDEIMAAQHPIAGWESENRAFLAADGIGAGIDATPRWADFTDPLEAISRRAQARAGEIKTRAKANFDAATAHARPRMTPDERRALGVLGLSMDADRHQLRARYSELVRRYHPDRNGGDRSHEGRLQAVVEAYQLLRKAAVFA